MDLLSGRKGSPSLVSLISVLLMVVRLEVVRSATVMTPCPRDKPNGLYPHPTDCAAFITCIDGMYYVKSCPETLHFNPEDQVCDWPDNVRCLTASPQEMASINHYGAGHPGGRIMARLVEQFHKGDLSFQCPMEHGSMALSQDCGLFIRCSQWRSVLHSCREQRVFNPKEGICVPESLMLDSSHCVRRSDFRCPAAQGIFPDQLDRTKYYNCWSFRWYHQICPKGLMFNHRQRWCDYSWNIEDTPLDNQGDSAGVPIAELQRNSSAESSAQRLQQHLQPVSDPGMLLHAHPDSFSGQQFFLQNKQLPIPSLAENSLTNNPHVGNDNARIEQPFILGSGPVSTNTNGAVPFAVQNHPHFTSQHQQPQPNRLPDLSFDQQIQTSNMGVAPAWHPGAQDVFRHNVNQFGIQPQHQHAVGELQPHSDALASNIDQTMQDQHFVSSNMRPDNIPGQLYGDAGAFANPNVAQFPGIERLFDDFVRRRYLPSYTMANSTRAPSAANNQIPLNTFTTSNLIHPGKSSESHPDVQTVGLRQDLSGQPQNATAARKFRISFRTPEMLTAPRNAVDLSALALNNTSDSAHSIGTPMMPLPINNSFVSDVQPQQTGNGLAPHSFNLIIPDHLHAVPKSRIVSDVGISNSDAFFSEYPELQKKRVGIRRYFNKTSLNYTDDKRSLPLNVNLNRYLSSLPFG